MTPLKALFSVALGALLLIHSPLLGRPSDKGWQGDYVVKAGDSLWSIAAHDPVLGDAWLWPLIWRANAGKIQDPNLLKVGWSLSMPLDPGAAEIAGALTVSRAYGESEPLAAAPPLRASSGSMSGGPTTQAALPLMVRIFQRNSMAWNFLLSFIAMAAALLILADVAWGLYGPSRHLPLPDFQPTESEAILRAMQDPEDPLHPFPVKFPPQDDALHEEEEREAA